MKLDYDQNYYIDFRMAKQDWKILKLELYLQGGNKDFILFTLYY